MDKSQEQREYEKQICNRHTAFQALLKARDEEAKAKAFYDSVCLQTKIVFHKYQEFRAIKG